MDQKVKDQFEGLVEKYTELMLGESSPELVEKIKMWSLYMHISKSMPPLAKHWNEMYPDAKDQMKILFGEIKSLNEDYRTKK